MTEKIQHTPETNNSQETLAQSIVEEVKGIEQSRKEFPNVDELLKNPQNQEYLKNLSLDTFLDFELNENEKEKISEILERGIIEITDPIDIEVNNRVYQSIDDYNPPIDITKDNSEELNNIFKIFRKSSLLIDIELQGSSEELGNEPVENEKISSIIMEVYLENKEEIDKELGITDITHLLPEQAAKLSSLITMYKLEYDNAQAIFPGVESTYISGMSEADIKLYNIDKVNTLYISRLLNYPDYVSDFDIDKFKIEGIYGMKDKLNTEDISPILKKELSSITNEEMNRLSQMSTNKMKAEVNKIIDKKMSEKGFSISEGNHKLFTRIFWGISKVSNEHLLNDTKSISDLLKDGKGICRNYAIANESIFETLKTMQDPNNDKLKSSILVYYTGNDLSDDKKSIIAETEKGSNNHAWNTLITIGTDGKKYISQIDSTWSDTGSKEGGEGNEGFNIDQVRTLDRTFDRLLNDFADNMTDDEFSKVGIKLQEYILKLEDNNGNEDKLDMMIKKITTYYQRLRIGGGKKIISEIYVKRGLKSETKLLKGMNEGLYGKELYNLLDKTYNYSKLSGNKNLKERIKKIYVKVGKELNDDVLLLVNEGLEFKEYDKLLKKTLQYSERSGDKKLIDRVKNIYIEIGNKLSDEINLMLSEGGDKSEIENKIKSLEKSCFNSGSNELNKKLFSILSKTNIDDYTSIREQTLAFNVLEDGFTEVELLELLGEGYVNSNEGLLGATFIYLLRGEAELSDSQKGLDFFKLYLEKNPDYLKLDKVGRYNYILENNPIFGVSVLDFDIIEDKFIDKIK